MEGRQTFRILVQTSHSPPNRSSRNYFVDCVFHELRTPQVSLTIIADFSANSNDSKNFFAENVGFAYFAAPLCTIYHETDDAKPATHVRGEGVDLGHGMPILRQSSLVFRAMA